jgi:hypothetical protein
MVELVIAFFLVLIKRYDSLVLLFHEGIWLFGTGAEQESPHLFRLI